MEGGSEQDDSKKEISKEDLIEMIKTLKHKIPKGLEEKQK